MNVAVATATSQQPAIHTIDEHVGVLLLEAFPERFKRVFNENVSTNGGQYAWAVVLGMPTVQTLQKAIENKYQDKEIPSAPILYDELAYLLPYSAFRGIPHKREKSLYENWVRYARAAALADRRGAENM